MPFSTCDLCDAHADALTAGTLAVLPPVFSSYGACGSFAGPAYTLKVFEDNALVRTTLETRGAGQVLVIDGGGSLRGALVGGNLGALAVQNGWAGIVVFGAVRDVVELNACDIGIRALGLHPQRSARAGVGNINVRVMIAGVAVTPGSWIYADADGVLVSTLPIH
ncbi:MAG: ribonuclease E activity regulator RraA [Herminiimonas sp.]|nr:ribonuclease E activity regulator RraA [Herminiimonas sp.]